MLSQTLCFPRCLFIICRCFLSLLLSLSVSLWPHPKIPGYHSPFSARNLCFLAFSLSSLSVAIHLPSKSCPLSLAPSLRLGFGSIITNAIEYWPGAKSARQSIQLENYVMWHHIDRPSFRIPSWVVSSAAPCPLLLSHLVYFLAFAPFFCPHLT